MKERFIESPNGQYIRDLKAEKSYRLTVENVFIVLNRVDKWDNRAFDLIEKELTEQEDENVKKVLMKILYSLTKNEQYKGEFMSENEEKEYCPFCGEELEDPDYCYNCGWPNNE